MGGAQLSAASFAAFLLLCFLPLRFWGGRWHSVTTTDLRGKEAQRSDMLGRGVWRLPELKLRTVLPTKNQGSTCYLNSALQILFMSKEFRENIERYISVGH
uniref:Peptidase C19 ubiquitin carboxyl-terminal hydrolase domain-containing protein n=1 Tax=Denticeps clupeoides TaxID=299321 RepID=A0AAY4A2K4_9TELE